MNVHQKYLSGLAQKETVKKLDLEKIRKRLSKIDNEFREKINREETRFEILQHNLAQIKDCKVWLLEEFIGKGLDCREEGLLWH